MSIGSRRSSLWALPKGEARADFIAGCLGIDRRTLNLRLARAGLNYSAVVASVRKNLVAQYLIGSERSLSDIAGLLGFNSLTTFGRWFRQSFGCAPRTWRRTEQKKLRL